MVSSRSDNDDYTDPVSKKIKKAVPTRKRGPTRMKHIVRARNKKVTFLVAWNAMGQPIGRNSIKMSSYLGATTRSIVPINIEDWDHVDEALKNSIWEDVQLTFKVPDKKRSWIISQAGLKWKDFKSYLTRKKMFDSDGNINKEPPEIYPFIDKEQWNDFLDSRLDEKFRNMSETNSLAARENKCPQKCSRKGAARLEQEQLAKMASSENAPTSLPRGTMWKLMRTSVTNGEILDEATREVAQKIDMLSERSQQGEFPDSGREDVLFKVLGKEHGGRVRGVGSGVTVTDYFGSLSNPKETRDEVNELKLIVNKLSNEVILLKNQQQKVTSNSTMTSHLEKEDTESVIIPEGISTCKLALSDPTYHFVATGKVHNFLHCSRYINGKPLSSNQVRVSIEHSLENEAILPIPMKEAYIVAEALGTHVAWPKHLVVVDEKTPTIVNDKGEKESASSILEKTSSSLEGKVTKSQKQVPSCNHTNFPSNIPAGASMCMLALSDPIYRIVAKGRVHNLRVLHGKPLLPDQVRVSIDYALDNEALLPIPLKDEAYTVNEALGNHIAWPRHLVILDGKSVTNSKDKGDNGASSCKARKKSTSFEDKAESEKKVTRSRDTNQSISIPKGITSCNLALSDPFYSVVAMGKVHNFAESSFLHGKPLLPDQGRVSIEYALENDALLPIPLEDEAYTLKEALGTHVAWPKHLIILNLKTSDIPKDKGKLDAASSQLKKTSSSIQIKDKSHNEKARIPPKIANNSNTQEVLNPDSLPRELRAVYMFVNRMGKNEQIMLPMDKSAVNRSQPIYIGQE